MAARVVLITGCSTGIGLSAAVLLANDKEKRFKVYATMRDIAKKDKLEEAGKETLGETLFVRALDVCSEESVNAVVQELLDTHQRIDILINNAGRGLLGALEDQTMDTIRGVFETNFFGLLRVTQAVLPSMKRNREGHIINISSMGGISGVPFNDVYCASKFAVEGLTESMAPTLLKFNVRCSLIEPGPVSTPFSATAQLVGSDADSSTSPPSSVHEETMQLLENVRKKMQIAFTTVVQTPDEIAHVIMEALLADKPHLRYQTNKNYAAAAANKLVDPTGDKFVEVSLQRFLS